MFAMYNRPPDGPLDFGVGMHTFPGKNKIYLIRQNVGLNGGLKGSFAADARQQYKRSADFVIGIGMMIRAFPVTLDDYDSTERHFYAESVIDPDIVRFGPPRQNIWIWCVHVTAFAAKLVLPHNMLYGSGRTFAQDMQLMI